MKNTLFYFIALAILFVCNAHAQSPSCGTVFSAEDYTVDDEKEPYIHRYFQMKSLNRDTVAISIHIVESISGAAGIDFQDILSEITKVNSMFRESGITFLACGSERYIRGSSLYNYTSSAQLNQQNHIGNTLNIYYADVLTDNQSNPLCGFASFPWAGPSASRYIMMDKDCSDGGATLAHELGHYFGLLHTHETATGYELADGTNCEDAGDLICDTPADPLLGFNNVNGSCNYTGTSRDPNGIPYLPSTSNLMSYAPSSCRKFFTLEQAATMRYYYETASSHILQDCSFYPDLAIENFQQNYSITSGQTIEVRSAIRVEALEMARDIVIHLRLSENQEEMGYIVRRDTVSLLVSDTSIDYDFDFEFPLTKTSGTYFMSLHIDASHDLFERTEENNLAIFAVEVDNSGYVDLLLYPNPVKDKFRVFIRDKRLTQQILISIWNRNGQLMKQIESYKSDQEYFEEVDISDLAGDFYICEIFFLRNEERRSFPLFKVSPD